ncbi:MAG TPA: hypothetical protein VFY71_03985 [Planctomycetota bacterium]|nr:hypothetical protein [Planctomycetota bacterium]
MSIYIGTGLHGASFGNLGVMLGLMAWGAVSAGAVLLRKRWACKLFLAWGVVSLLALAIAAITESMSWKGTVALMAGVALAMLLVRQGRRATV